MNKYFKHIKIHGRLKSRGEYVTDSMEFRPYEAVTIIDDDGEEIHFTLLSVPKRIDEYLSHNESICFYILRKKYKDEMYGILYAIKTKDKKIFYKDLVVPALKAFSRTQSIIWLAIFQQGAFLIVSSIFIVSLVFAFIFHFVFGFIGGISWILGILISITFFFSPIYLSASRAGISEMYKILQDDGFNISSVVDSKY